MYTQLLDLLREMSEGQLRVISINDSAIGAAVNVIDRRSEVIVDMCLDGPCSKQQVRALISALLCHSIDFKEQGQGKYTARIPKSETSLS